MARIASRLQLFRDAPVTPCDNPQRTQTPMPNSRKKVIVRRFSGDTLPGYLPHVTFVRNSSIDLLDLGGRILTLPLSDIKTVSYVRDFNLSDMVNPERLTRRTFLARPRTEGLWLRLTFRSGDLLEGLAPTDRSLLDSLVDDAGLFLPPPDPPSRRQPIAKPSKENLQEELFHLPLDPTSRPN